MNEGPVQEYLRALRRELRRDPILARRAVEEAADHLQQIVAAERRNGMSQRDAEEAAVRRFGPVGSLARQLQVFALPLKLLVGFASLITVAVAFWLFTVIAGVLPARDPAHIPLWTGVAVGFLAYSSLCLAYLLLGPSHRWLRAAVLILSGGAVALGLYGIARMVTADSRHFEGYILLMGFILAGHGLAAFIYTATSALIARRITGR